MLHAARRAKRDEFADPDLFDRNREEEEAGVSAEPEDPAAAKLNDEEELPLGETPTLEGAETDEDDSY